MELYHYSNNDFKNFIINKKFQITDDTALQEEEGIYLSDEKEFFSSYGNICYTVEIENIYDFTNEENIYDILDIFLKKYDKNNLFLNYKYHINDYIEGITDGKYSITKLLRNIWLYMEENFYSTNYNFDLYDYEDYLLESWENFLKLKVIKYYDNNFKKNVYIAKNEKLLKIVEKIKKGDGKKMGKRKTDILGLKVKYLDPTNTKGIRIKITALNTGKSVIIRHNYRFNNSLEQVFSLLNKIEEVKYYQQVINNGDNIGMIVYDTEIEINIIEKIRGTLI